ncbi:MAG TPA: protein translocase subunit SecF [Mariprofundaceae bacterium]|nr:protein translocase subunit SecF [Mariprofundaceae bacterium]
MELIRTDTHIDFLGKRKLAMGISGTLVLLSVIMLIVKGLNFGIDFTGGTLVETRFSQAPAIADVREALAPKGYGNAVIQQYGAPTEIMIRVQNRDSKASSAISNAVLDALNAKFGANQVEMRRVEYVGPQVGKELTRAGIMAVLFAMIAIFGYVMFRFEFRYAVGADLALVHDTSIVLGAFAVTGMEFNLTVVAAVLTVIGYSLNDTIVVFDRIREMNAANRKKKNPEDEPTTANNAINQTLSRTLITSFTVLIVLLSLFFLGGEVIHGFAFALLVGVVVGTYSSIYIASPIMLMMKGQTKADEEAAKELEARP